MLHAVTLGVLTIALATHHRHPALPRSPAAATSRSIHMLAADVDPNEPDEMDTKPSPLSLLADSVPAASVSPTSGAACTAAPTADQRRRNIALACAAPILATAFYGFQKANPVSPVALLARMEERSPALPDALASGLPTMVEFYGASRPSRATRHYAPLSRARSHRDPCASQNLLWQRPGAPPARSLPRA